MSNYPTLEESLSQAAPQPGEQFAANLRSHAMQTYDQNLTPATPKRSAHRQRPFFRWASALALVLLIGMFFTPPGRTLAQAILQFSLFVFTDEPTAAEQNLTATPEGVYFLVSVNADLESASETAGFPVYYPAFLPEGYSPLTLDPASPVEIVYNSAGAVSSVGAMFEEAESGKILSFSQIPFNPAEGTPPLNFGTGQAEPQTITVSGNEGIWLQDFSWGTKLDENGNPVPVPYNLLIWQLTTDDGETFQFWLGSEALFPLNVMVQIAESISP